MCFAAIVFAQQPSANTHKQELQTSAQPPSILNELNDTLTFSQPRRLCLQTEAKPQTRPPYALPLRPGAPVAVVGTNRWGSCGAGCVRWRCGDGSDAAVQLTREECGIRSFPLKSHIHAARFLPRGLPLRSSPSKGNLCFPL